MNNQKTILQHPLALHMQDWTDTELETLATHYAAMGTAVKNLLPNRTESAVLTRAWKMGLSYTAAHYAPILSLSPNDVGYLAGIIDGEGSIMLRKTILNDRNIPRFNYRPIVEVANTDGSLFDWLRSRLAPISPSYKCLEGHDGQKNVYYMNLDSNGMVHSLLRLVYGSLVIKKERARLLLEFTQKRIGATKFRVPYDERDEQIYQEIKRLNKRGLPRRSIIKK